MWKVLVSISRQFYGWVTGIGSVVRITGAEEVVKDYCKYMKDLMEQ